MALPSSGQLSFSQVIAEFGQPLNRSLSQYYGAAPGVPTSGVLTLAHFYGKGYKMYRWWRLWLSEAVDPNTLFWLNEIELHEFVGGADITTPSTVISASSTPPLGEGDFRPYRLLDGNLGTAWRSYPNSGSGRNQWVLIDLGTPRSVREIMINSGIWANNIPRVFELHGSNDGANFQAVGWYTVPSGTWPVNTWRTFAV